MKSSLYKKTNFPRNPHHEQAPVCTHYRALEPTHRLQRVPSGTILDFELEDTFSVL